ncbi:phosphopantothenoylcysteine decarboxylase / phosphopantothenate--cysteine ligase [Catalinimonas alkaloidigena]|uniref:Coenzyme A biosynthesis bifunctional protein CoaBC n=1 Tax=Catalinimonas alkaloidigena TaxID=1075417 RepID=A0A1G8W9P2_9BACT|nr:bifunctional phosphopantothenoylcysteine decarboxylase/phosphopantothenate--cysteine ligase CoaBC [Catalinimonas alkaloidigena]SDJ74984.1 phosphopantothenoylcysteine decarboxylase / phosphopantothenate--cysteine ligase [Catalinimonas alkaloidigena]
MLQHKKIILGVCGSIAAYKAALLTRLLIKSEADVQVIMTPAASDFITPLTLATLSKRPALSKFVRDAQGSWNNHVELGLWADALVIAPLSAHTLAKMAHGQCDTLLLATYLSARCPVFVAPAMDLDMYAHPTTVENLARLRSFGNRVLDAEQGELASGLHGTGRMAEPEHIVAALEAFFAPTRKRLAGKKALVTAGPTFEAIDPVRFIGNHSTGKMGYALAEALRDEGADVTLLSGPTHLPDPAGIQTRRVQTAQEMFDAAQAPFAEADLAVFAAAVADYTPREVATQKIKKTDDDLFIPLKRTPDIAQELGKRKRPGQLTVGFALETHDEEHHALGKLTRKNLDWIVLNSLNDPGAGFGHDTNKVTLHGRNGEVRQFALKSKVEVARDLVDTMVASLRTLPQHKELSANE